jgi:molecular chaperone DnaJ
MQLRLTGEGGAGCRGPAGDLYVLVRIAEHELFVRDGADLYCDIPVTFPQLALGARSRSPCWNGTETLTIPGHPAPRDRALRNHGHAAPARPAPGDACYRLILEVPRQLSARQREALQAYAAAESDPGPLSLSFLERMKKLLG